MAGECVIGALLITGLTWIMARFGALLQFFGSWWSLACGLPKPIMRFVQCPLRWNCVVASVILRMRWLLPNPLRMLSAWGCIPGRLQWRV